MVYYTPSASKGGRLHFKIFETERIEDCIDFIAKLMTSARELAPQAKQVLQATGGGAHLFYNLLEQRLPGVVVEKDDEMECLTAGKFFELFPPTKKVSV